MVEIIIVSAIGVFILCLYECRLQKAEAEVERLKEWACGVEKSFGDVGQGIRNLTNTGSMHNDVIGSLVAEVADLNTFVEMFRSLRNERNIQ